MSAITAWFRSLYDRHAIKEDAVAGIVLGVESVPDGLAGGLLAGVNPVFGLYGDMVGTITGALFTSATLMVVHESATVGGRDVRTPPTGTVRCVAAGHALIRWRP